MQLVEHLLRVRLQHMADEAEKMVPPDWPRPLPPGIMLFSVGMGVLRHFLGSEDFSRLVNPNLRGAGFLRPSSNASRNDCIFAMQRVTDFAEALFNLQWTDGFEHALEEFHGAADVQVGVHTLDLGMLFKQAGLSFRFRKALGTPGLGNHDIDLYHGSWTICVETKAKAIDGRASKRSLDESLSYANKQLPQTAPSIIAVRLPATWVQSAEDIMEIRRWAGNFLHSHRAIVRVVILLDAPGLPEDGPLRAFAVLDEPNREQIFGADLGGPLFTSDIYPSSRWLSFKEFFGLVPRVSPGTLEEGRRILHPGGSLSSEYLYRLLTEAGAIPPNRSGSSRTA